MSKRKRRTADEIRAKFKITDADLADARKLIEALDAAEERWRHSPEFYAWIRSHFRVIEGGRSEDEQ